MNVDAVARQFDPMINTKRKVRKESV